MDDYDFSNWFDDDYGSGYTPATGGSNDYSGGYVPDNAGGTFGNWSQGNYDYDYGNTSDYGMDYYNNNNNQYSGQDYQNPATSYSGWTQPQSIQYAQPTSNTNWGKVTDSVGGSIKNVLSDLFTKGTTSNMVGQGLAALASGYQNKQKASQAQKIASQLDPWAQQRGFYQQQAKQAVTNPYDSPIVKAQIAQLQKAQNIKDAAAGRRSNVLTSSPAVQAQMAQIAQQYQQQMASQGGANINPAGLAQTLQTGANAGVDGYISPIANLFGNQTQSNTNDKRLEALSKFFSQG